MEIRVCFLLQMDTIIIILLQWYKEYKNMRTGKVYTFLVVHDGWSTTTRYIAMKNTGASYVACQTSIKVPSKKK